MNKSYIDVRNLPQKGVTEVLEVFSVGNPELVLGIIKWYAPWRRYCFFPSPGTLFDVNCMNSITDMIEEMMRDRKVAKALKQFDESLILMTSEKQRINTTPKNS